MNVKIVAAVLLLLTLGGSMTQPTPNDGLLSLPSAVQGVEEPPVVMRIGVVSNIVEADNITVRISGSSVLVTASYLFPLYQPVLGDRVVVYRQDSQWFVVGPMSGPINTTLLNPSFEEGTVGALPTNWTFTVIASAGGVPTFVKQASADISGRFIGTYQVTSAAAGTSVGDLISSAAPASAGQRWAMAYYLTYAYINLNAAQVSQSGNTTVETFIEFLDVDGVVISSVSASLLYIGANVIQEILVRTVTTTGDNFVTAPANTARARIRVRFSTPMSATSTTSIGIDYMVLRTPDA